MTRTSPAAALRRRLLPPDRATATAATASRGATLAMTQTNYCHCTPPCAAAGPSRRCLHRMSSHAAVVQVGGRACWARGVTVGGAGSAKSLSGGKDGVGGLGVAAFGERQLRRRVGERGCVGRGRGCGRRALLSHSPCHCLCVSLSYSLTHTHHLSPSLSLT